MVSWEKWKAHRVYKTFFVLALADDERKKLEEKEALEEKKREEAERKHNLQAAKFPELFIL